MLDLVTPVAYVLARYLHFVAMTLLVGGTLFYLWVVPVAISDLKDESKLAVFSRARWVFRRVVFVSTVTLLLTGALLTARSMWIYRGQEIPIFRELARIANPTSPNTATLDNPTIFEKPVFWFAVHSALGLISIVIAVALVRGGRPPHSPLPWMRLNFGLLMVVILMACMSRNARMRLFESVRPAARAMPVDVRE